MKTFALAALATSVAATDVATQFEQFKEKFNRQYKDAADELKHFKIFTKNAERVNLMKLLDPSASYSVLSPFADVHQDEFGARNTLQATKKVMKEHKAKAHTLTAAAPLPDSFDWISKGAVTNIKNQGQCGSCWAFATVASMEGSNFLVNKNLISLSEQELVDCDKDDDGCQGGLPSNAYKDMIDNKMGLELETAYPYTAQDGTCGLKQALEKVFVASWKPISTDETVIAQAMMTYGPLAIGINANPMQLYTGGIADPADCPAQLDHGVTLVSFGETNGTKWWRIKNSWGTSWGENGYYRIVRGKGACGLNTMVTAVTAAASSNMLDGPAVFV